MAFNGDNCNFIEITNNQELANFLQIRLRDLTMLAYSNKITVYKEFRLPKKDPSKERTISASIGLLKRVQKQLLVEFTKLYSPPNSTHGFVPECSTVTNALHHVRKSCVVNIDLENFFPSISGGRIHGLFLKEPFCFPEEVANTLTNLVCHNGTLPQGAPTSPILSNFICRKLDKQLSSYAHTHKLAYTRYADDITFSSTNRSAINSVIIEDIFTGVLTVSDPINEIITKNGFRINESKTSMMRKGTRQVVTGIVVNKKCNFRRSEYRELRVLFHNWKMKGCFFAAKKYADYRPEYLKRFLDEKNNINKSLFQKHIRGRLDYYSMIVASSGKRSLPLERMWSSYHKLTGESVPCSLPEESVFMLHFEYTSRNEEIYINQGTCFLLDEQRLITCDHCLNDGTTGNIIENDFEIKIRNKETNCTYLWSNDFQRLPIFDFAAHSLPKELTSHPSLHSNSQYLPQVGETVTAIGFTSENGHLKTMTATVVEIKKEHNTIAVDKPFIHGMSDGPVLNAKGEAIGYITLGSPSNDYFKDGEFVCFRFTEFDN